MIARLSCFLLFLQLSLVFSSPFLQNLQLETDTPTEKDSSKYFCQDCLKVLDNTEEQLSLHSSHQVTKLKPRDFFELQMEQLEVIKGEIENLQQEISFLKKKENEFPSSHEELTSLNPPELNGKMLEKSLAELQTAINRIDIKIQKGLKKDFWEGNEENMLSEIQNLQEIVKKALLQAKQESILSVQEVPEEANSLVAVKFTSGLISVYDKELREVGRLQGLKVSCGNVVPYSGCPSDLYYIEERKELVNVGTKGIQFHDLLMQAEKRFIETPSSAHTLAKLPGTRLAVGLSNGDVWVIDYKTGEIHKLEGSHSYLVATLAFNAKTQQLWSGAHSKELVIWDMANYSLIKTLHYEKGISNIIALTNGQMMLGMNWGDVLILDSFGNTLRKLEVPGHLESLFLSRSGILVVGVCDGKMYLYDFSTLELKGSLWPHVDCYTGSRIIDLGSELYLSGNNDESLMIVDSKSMEVIQEFYPGERPLGTDYISIAQIAQGT